MTQTLVYVGGIQDNGETCSPLDAFFKKFGSVGKERTVREVFRELFPFLATADSKKLAELGNKLAGLRESFFLRSDRNNMRLKSVARFIFTSNQIEGCSTATEGDTVAVINGSVTSEMEGRAEVEATLRVLRMTYNPDPEKMLTDLTRSLTVGDILKWHENLTAHDKACCPGTFRTKGAFTYRERKVKHNYPHHEYVRGVMKRFCEVLAQMIVLCGKSEAEDAALHWLAVAAFAQFHLVTLHPFKDGNGRMCRIIAKLILDCWMPVAIPMFPQKEAYFQALVEGQSMLENNRDANELFCIEPLFHLLMATSIEHLDRVLNGRTNVFVRYEAASEETTGDVLKALTDRNIDAKAAREQIERELSQLGGYDSVTFTLDVNALVSVTLHRLPNLPLLPQVSSYFEKEGSESPQDASVSVSFEDDFE